MFELYGNVSPNVIKISLMLEELGLQARFHDVNCFAEEQFSPQFLRLNPNHKVPVLVDSDGPGGHPLVLFESGAILIYLAEKAGRFLAAPGSAARYEELKWLMIQLTGAGPMFGQYVHFSAYAPPGNDYAKDRYWNELQRLYRVLERRLAEVPYLGGDDYSIADIAMFPWVAHHARPGEWLQSGSWSGLANVKHWYEQIARRPAAITVLKSIDPLLTTALAQMKAASATGIARFLGRQLPV